MDIIPHGNYFKTLSFAASVHFQHTAELVKLLSMHNVNYTLKVSMAALWIEPGVYFCPCNLFCNCMHTATFLLNCFRFFLMRAMTLAANTTCWVLSSPSSVSASMKTLLSPWKPVRKTSFCGLSDFSWTQVGFEDKMAAITSILDMGAFVLIPLVLVLPDKGTEDFLVSCSNGANTLSHTLSRCAQSVWYWKISWAALLSLHLRTTIKLDQWYIF